MHLEDDKRLNLQLRLDFSSAPTGEAWQAKAVWYATRRQSSTPPPVVIDRLTDGT
jgi:hypothetical protein